MNTLRSLFVVPVEPKKTSKIIRDPLKALRKNNLPRYIPSSQTFESISLPEFNLENNIFAQLLKQPGRRDRITRQKIPKSFLLQLKARGLPDDLKLVPQWPQNALTQSSYITNNKKIISSLHVSQIKMFSPMNILMSPVHNIESKNLETFHKDMELFVEKLETSIHQALVDMKNQQLSGDDTAHNIHIISDPNNSEIFCSSSGNISFNFGHIEKCSFKSQLPVSFSSSNNMELLESIYAFLDYHSSI